MQKHKIFLDKVAKLSSAIEHTNDAISEIESMTRNSANYQFSLSSNPGGEVMCFDVSVFADKMLEILKQLRINKSNLDELFYQIFDEQKYYLIDDFDHTNYFNDCYCIWIKQN